MLKATSLGLFLNLTVMPIAIAQAPPLITDICPEATWTTGYRIGELIPLHPDQYRPAVTITQTPLRSSYGFAAPVITDLGVGAQVTITGEVWDIGCHQWIAIVGDQQTNFVHGPALLNLEP